MSGARGARGKSKTEKGGSEARGGVGMRARAEGATVVGPRCEGSCVIERAKGRRRENVRDTRDSGRGRAGIRSVRVTRAAHMLTLQWLSGQWSIGCRANGVDTRGAHYTARTYFGGTSDGRRLARIPLVLESDVEESPLGYTYAVRNRVRKS